MSISIKKKEKYTRLKINENIDLKLAPLLKSEIVVLVGKEEKNILLDISKCNHCDESGVNALKISSRLCENARGVLVIGGIQPKIEHLLEITHANKKLNLSYNINQAEDMILSHIAKNQ